MKYKAIIVSDLHLGTKDSKAKEFIDFLDTHQTDLLILNGDIIDGWAVTYCGDQQAGLGMSAGWYLQRDDFESWTELQSRCNENGDNYEVSGNIYETPELLTK